MNGSFSRFDLKCVSFSWKHMLLVCFIEKSNLPNHLPFSVVYSESCKTSKIERFTKIVRHCFEHAYKSFYSRLIQENTDLLKNLLIQI